jgi:transcriptional regulator with XRE-family HTH domain
MMKREKLSQFAKDLEIGSISLRQFITGQTQRPRSRTLELLAEALDMSVEEVRRRAAMNPKATPPFDEWLRDRIDGAFSRARLTRETGISDGALRNYLSGQTLPDANQAQRLAEILDEDPLELAKVLVADHTRRAEGSLDPAEETDTESDEEGELADPMLAGTMIGARGTLATASADEDQLLHLWRQLHPQGRRATLTYIASLLVEG